MPDASDARRALGLVDLTDLGEDTTAEAVTDLCRRAVGPWGSTAAVCVWPRFVGVAVASLRGSGVRVATVVNFPHGDDDVEATCAETRSAVDNGADEVDLVLPYRAFLAGRVDLAEAMVDAVRHCAPDPITLKVILETGAYPDQDSIAAAARLAIDRGADFVKTSTGKTAVSATPAAVRTMLDVIRERSRTVGIKPSGGIRTLDDACTYLALADEVMGEDWVSARTFRFGASGLLDALEAVLAGAAFPPPPGDY